ncbi:MAG: YchJ family protein [Corynebacterium casei]|uniref:YchJ-like middle NTF2-like domain-containing protein n=2 Tax=Corynebacterium casei TaxID=160386 RepID=G7I196_9CORY|nr:YchJ family metal-binding protein [Corynebacterium casei]AHI19972.1 hypothetical protein CCASEI_07005 [Corynebacterium casei LMG S-19264]MDN5705774.1 hypothetical protein [Corynebacterium casei]MDN5728207.1 hypothetical protein [Corynebacterium casei]MDN5739980.1 hypothetical protein [Corynebacterium casei]MDN5783291.1 hypothetical protein [Corynebacterium casei]
MDILNPLPADVRCPCGTGLTFGECCKKYHDGAPAPTAETLMRSRFSAFVTGDEAYLLGTWDPDTRPGSLNLAESFAADSGIRFYRLDIIDTAAGSPLDDTGMVEFEAFYKGAAKGSQRERSSFRRMQLRDDHPREWVYSTGDVS